MNNKKQKQTTKRNEDSFNKRSKVTAAAITAYNFELAKYKAAMRKTHEHYIPALYSQLRKYMPIKQARDRLHTDLVDSELIAERTFREHLPDEAKDMRQSHTKGRKMKTVQSLADGQTMEVPDTDADIDIEGSGLGHDDDIDDDDDEDELDNEDGAIPVTTEREFLESFKGSQPFDSSFAVGIRTVNFAIKGLTDIQNNEAQKLLHEMIRETFALICKSHAWSIELSGKLHEKLKLNFEERLMLNDFTDMALSIGSSVLSWDKSKRKENKKQ